MNIVHLRACLNITKKLIQSYIIFYFSVQFEVMFINAIHSICFVYRDSRGSIEPNEVIAINSKDSSTPLLLGETEELASGEGKG